MTKAMPTAEAGRIDTATKAFLVSAPDRPPGLWLAVWDPAKGYYEQAYGYAVAGTTKATVADHSWIGSITKTVFVTAVLQQIAAGKLALSDTVRGVDPELAAKYPAIGALTVAQLIGMTSGISDYADAAIAALVKNHEISYTRDDLIALGLSLGAPKPAGTGGYSTTNIIIMGVVMTKLTGKTPEELVNDVFAQAGMTQSHLPSSATPLPDPASHGYVGALGVLQLKDLGVTDRATTDVTAWNFDYGKEGGGAYSIIGDLATWGGTCLGNSLLPPAMVTARLRTTAIKGVGDYGLGIIGFKNGWFGHSGQVLGWNADVYCNTKTGAVFAVMTNSTDGGFGLELVRDQIFPGITS